jgi:hypothetical protein
VGAAIADARKEADTIAAGKAATVVEYIDGAQGYVGDAQTTSSQSSGLAAFGTVLEKIDLFVKIVDKTASVCGLVFI